MLSPSPSIAHGHSPMSATTTSEPSYVSLGRCSSSMTWHQVLPSDLGFTLSPLYILNRPCPSITFAFVTFTLSFANTS